MVVESKSSSVNSNNISESGYNWEIFESLCVEDQSGIVTGVASAFLSLEVKTGVDDLQRAYVFIFVGLVRERSINDDSIDVLGF